MILAKRNELFIVCLLIILNDFVMLMSCSPSSRRLRFKEDKIAAKIDSRPKTGLK